MASLRDFFFEIQSIRHARTNLKIVKENYFIKKSHRKLIELDDKNEHPLERLSGEMNVYFSPRNDDKKREEDENNFK